MVSSVSSCHGNKKYKGKFFPISNIKQWLKT